VPLNTNRGVAKPARRRACLPRDHVRRAVLRRGHDGDGRRSVASFGAPCNAPDRRLRAASTWAGQRSSGVQISQIR